MALLAARSKILSLMKNNKTDLNDGDILGKLVAYGSDQVVQQTSVNNSYYFTSFEAIPLLFTYIHDSASVVKVVSVSPSQSSNLDQ